VTTAPRAAARKTKKKRAPKPAPPRPASSIRLAIGHLRRRRLGLAASTFLGVLALVAALADVLASDLPILCKIHGTTYVLPAITRPPALAAYDNQRIARETDGPAEGWAVYPLVRFGPVPSPDRPIEPEMEPPRLGSGHPLGTDAQGRDVFARLVHGARTSLTVSLLAVLAFVSVGGALGALAGFFGGMLDAAITRLVETLSAFPTIVLVLVVQALVPSPSLLSLLVGIGLTRWPEISRIVRAEVLLVGSAEYVTAARALGASPWRVLLRHVVPNIKAPIVVAMTFGLAQVVLLEASLSFLRVGVPPPTPSWGEMLSEVRDHHHAFWLLVFPGVLVFLSVAALNILGEALRDLLDPRLRLEAGPADRETGPEPAS